MSNRYHAPTKLLAYDPFTTFAGSNTPGVFLTRDNKNSFASGGLRGTRNSDLAALWALGKSAYQKLPHAVHAEPFDSGLKAFYAYIDETRGIICEMMLTKHISVMYPDGMLASQEWCQGAEPSEILKVAWSLSNASSPITDDMVNGTFLEAFCFACLLEIDNTLIGISLGGGDSISSALEACEANANAEAIASRNDRLQNARKQLAAQAAASRHLKDPRRVEKQRIYKCWLEWRENPDYYTGKADFARQMLDECEHLTSTKKIEDWCRDWEKEK